MDLEWADLRTIELSLLDSPDPAVVADLVATTKTAIKEDGFLFLTNYGVSLEQVRHLYTRETLSDFPFSVASSPIRLSSISACKYLPGG